MASSARRAFDKTTARVERLLALHGTIHGTPGRPRQSVSDLLRGALVLALAALDSLVVDSVVEALPAIARRGGLGSTPAKWIKEHSESIVACFAAADPPVALAEVAREQLGQITFQRSAAIEGVLRDVLGCDPPWENAARLLSAGSVLWTVDEVKEYLDDYVDRRNRIVHGGDMRPGGTAAEPIRRDYVESVIGVVKAVGQAVAAVVARRVRTA